MSNYKIPGVQRFCNSVKVTFAQILLPFKIDNNYQRSETKRKKNSLFWAAENSASLSPWKTLIFTTGLNIQVGKNLVLDHLLIRPIISAQILA